MESSILFIISLLVVAILYSMVGHGGASGYLAVMSIFSVGTEFFRSSALVMNLFVSAIAFISFHHGYRIRWRLFLPFLVPAIPMAFVGALVKINAEAYKSALGILLFIALLRLLYRPSHDYIVKDPPAIPPSVAFGAFLGFISGVIGIGGGIILSPVLILAKWSSVKETGVYSSLFILCNSLAGLLGLTMGGFLLPTGFSVWVLTVVFGGLVGSMTAMKFLPARYFKFSLALVLLFACYKLLVA